MVVAAVSRMTTRATGWLSALMFMAAGPGATQDIGDGFVVSIVPSDATALHSPVARNREPDAAQIEAMVRRAVDLIGALCTVTTTEVTESFGEAQYSTDGAPLKLTVRTESGVLSKGDTARIINFDVEHNSYTVILDSGGA